MKTLKRITKRVPISKTLTDLLNYRIEQEEYSSRIYLSMSMWLNDRGFMGASSLWKKYSDEELSHANLAYNFLLDMGIQPKVPALKEPPQDFDGLPDIIYKSYEHEVEVYNQCNALAKAALSEGNMLLYPLALKLTAEQVEELGKIQTWIDKLETFGTEPMLLRELDEEMGE